MNKLICRALALLLCCMLSLTALAEPVLLPGQVTAIEAEAFYGDESMTSAVIPEGAKTIGERAFAYSGLTTVVLPASLEEIAGNAFEGCDGLVATVNRDSYAHQYCVANDINYRLAEDLYSISALMRDGANFSLTVTTDEICVLCVEVLDEDSEAVLHTVRSGVRGSLDYKDVLLPIPEDVSFPTYYILRAVLLDGDGNALCEPYLTMQHTEAYAQFDSLTPEDFSEEENIVVDFGECGFGVIADGAIAIPGTSTTDDHETFVIPSDTAPKSGDVIVVTLPDGTQEPVKISSVIANTDGTTTVTRDPDTVLSDLYEVFKLDGVADVGEAAQNKGVAQMRAGDGSGSASLSAGFTYGLFSATATGTAGLTVKAFYNAELFGEDYVEQQVCLNLSITAKAKVTGAFRSSDIKDAFGNPVIPEFTLYEGPISLSGIGSVFAATQLKISCPIEFGFEASGEYTLTFTDKIGYSYTSTNGYTPIKGRSIDHDLQLKGAFYFKTGPKISLSVDILKGLLTGSISAQIGINGTGTVIPYDSSPAGSSVHGCKLCVDADLSVFAEAKGDIALKVSKKFKPNLSITLFSIRGSLGKAYMSVVNDEDSLFGGEFTCGLGKCPNYKYLVTVNAVNQDGNMESGHAITVTAGGTEKGSGVSPYKLYLYDGDYTATTEFESGIYDQDFTVLRKSSIVFVKESDFELSGTVTDKSTGEPISGARVTVTLGEDHTVTTMTNDEGYYLLTFEPVDSFSVVFSAEEYKDKTVFVSTGTSTSHVLNAQLLPATYTVTFHPVMGSGTMDPLTVETGSKFTLPSCSFTPPENMKFSSWSINGETYAPGSSYGSSTGENVDVYAEWEKKLIPDDAVIYNGHAYKLYPIHQTWSEASTLCTALGGHLVTITTAGEQDFVSSYASTFDFKGYMWIGCANPWSEWVTGEPLSYTNWGTGEPDGLSGQYYGCMLVNDEYKTSSWHIMPGQWDDWQGPRTYYMCEWDTVDYHEVSFNLNGLASSLNNMTAISGCSVPLPIPSREGYSFAGWNTAKDGSGETITSSTAISSNMTLYAQWKPIGDNIPEGAVYYNGSHYKMYDEYYAWNEAAAQCETLGGHLLTITSADEQAFVASYLAENGTRNVYWLGANCESGTEWKWVTDEAYDYVPDEQAIDYWGTAPYAMGIMDIEMFGPTGTWGDFEYQGYIPNDANYVIRYPEQFGYICEWDSAE